MFRDAVHEIVANGLKGLSHPIQGYIPEGGVDVANSLCTVRVPNPHGGINPNNSNTGNYLELKGVPLPFFVGIFIAWEHALKLGDRGVLVGFKGANMAFPYIISLLSLIPNKDKADQTVDDRKNVQQDRALSQAGAQVITPPDQLTQQILGVQSFDELFAPDLAPAPTSPLDDASLPFLKSNNDTLSNQLDNSILRDITPIKAP